MLPVSEAPRTIGERRSGVGSLTGFSMAGVASLSCEGVGEEAAAPSPFAPWELAAGDAFPLDIASRSASSSVASSCVISSFNSALALLSHSASLSIGGSPSTLPSSSTNHRTERGLVATGMPAIEAGSESEGAMPAVLPLLPLRSRQ